MKGKHMIKLSNGHEFEYMVASGALGFDGQGWAWEWPLNAVGLLRPELFTTVLRTITLEPRLYPVSNLSWPRFWTWIPGFPTSCIQIMWRRNTVVNRVGLYNPGFKWFLKEIAPNIDYSRYPVVASVYGNKAELVEMTKHLINFRFQAIEVNDSCPNTGHPMEGVNSVIESVKAVKAHCRHHFGVIVKVSVAQDYLAIADGLRGIADAVSLNSVPFPLAFPKGRKNPLRRLIKKLGGGGEGGVSGRDAQTLNWLASRELVEQGALQVAVPSVMNYQDLQKVRRFNPHAICFGSIHILTPWRPTSIVKRETKERQAQLEGILC